MPTRMVTVSESTRRATRLIAFGLLAFISVRTEILAAQSPADSVARWTQALQSGSDSAKIEALDRLAGMLAGMPAQQWPRATQTALLAELNRLHTALLSGVSVAPGTAEDHGEYYMTLAGLVAGMRTREAALALVPAVEVGTGIQQRVARYGGDDVVAPLVALVAKRYSVVDALETLGFVWFWADSTGSALSETSRGVIISTLAAAAASGEDSQIMGATAALGRMKNPSLLPLASVMRNATIAQGGLGNFARGNLDREIIPALSAAQSARSNAALLEGVARMVAVICASPSTSQRHGTCQSTVNDVATSAEHLSAGRNGPARNVLNTITDRLLRAKGSGEFTDTEYALLTGDLAALLARPW